MSLGIADALYREIDEKAHADFLWFADWQILQYRQKGSLVEDFEAVDDLEKLINAYLPVYAEEANWPLRPVKLRYDIRGVLISQMTPLPTPQSCDNTETTSCPPTISL